MENIEKRKSGKSIVGVVVMILLFIFIIFILAISFVFKSADSAPSILGYSIYIMDGNGMEPYVHDKAAVFVKNGSLPDGKDAMYKVALCNIVDNKFSTILRVYNIEEKDGKTNYLMKNDKSADTQMITVPKEKIIGEATHESIGLGMFISFVTS